MSYVHERKKEKTSSVVINFFENSQTKSNLSDTRTHFEINLLLDDEL